MFLYKKKAKSAHKADAYVLILTHLLCEKIEFWGKTSLSVLSVAFDYLAILHQKQHHGFAVVLFFWWRWRCVVIGFAARRKPRAVSVRALRRSSFPHKEFSLRGPRFGFDYLAILHQKTTPRFCRGAVFLVEMAVIETASENSPIPLSTCLVYALAFPFLTAHKQAARIGRLWWMTGYEPLTCSPLPLLTPEPRDAVTRSDGTAID